LTPATGVLAPSAEARRLLRLAGLLPVRRGRTQAVRVSLRSYVAAMQKVKVRLLPLCRASSASVRRHLLVDWAAA